MFLPSLLLTWALTFLNNTYFHQDASYSPSTIINNLNAALNYQVRYSLRDPEFYESKFVTNIFEGIYLHESPRMNFLRQTIKEIPEIKEKYTHEHLQLVETLYAFGNDLAKYGALEEFLVFFLGHVAAIDYKALPELKGDNIREVVKNVYNGLSDEMLQKIFGEVKHFEEDEFVDLIEFIESKGEKLGIEMIKADHRSIFDINFNPLIYDFISLLCIPKTSDEWKFFWVACIGDIKKSNDDDDDDYKIFFNYSRLYSILMLNLDHYPKSTEKVLKGQTKVNEIKTFLENALNEELENISGYDKLPELLAKTEKYNHFATTKFLEKQQCNAQV